MSVLSDTQFGLSLLNKTPSDESVVISPMSVSLALAVIHVGADGEAKEEILKVLDGGSDDKIFKYYKSVDASLRKKGDVLVNVGNRLYLRNEIKVEKSYKNKVYRNLSTKVENLVFENVGTSAETVTAFIKKKTKEVSKIPIYSRLFSASGMNAFLASTIYFEAKWKHKFQTTTSEMDFYVKERLYFANEALEILTLPYTDKKFTFTIILPRERFELASIRRELTGEKLQNLLKSVRKTRIDILVPKFSMEIDTDATVLLKALGINKVFSKEANLEKISSKVWISKITHKAIIEINENRTGPVKGKNKGKEATNTPNSQERLKFNANHPFLFFICRKDRVIFSGQYFGGEEPDLYETVDFKSDSLITREISEISDTQFGFSILKQMSKNESIVFSPLSIAFGLALVFVGAKGNVKEEIRKGLFGDVSDDQLLNYFKYVYACLREKSEVFVRIANRIFIRKGFEIRNSYKKTIAKNFSADAVNLDFNNDAAAAVGPISHVNRFIERATDGMISDCVGLNDFHDDMNALITNVIYFDAPWFHIFVGHSEENTLTFHINEGNSKTVQCLYASEMHELYSETDEARVLTLRYTDEKYTFTMILPKEKFGLEAFLKGLTAQKLQELFESVKKSSVDMCFPKFKFETEFDATKILKSLGINGMFSKEANLDEISPNIWIDSMHHKAIIDVNENGTRAAAVTTLRGCGSYGAEYYFFADHPFLFFIRREDKILFSGQYCG